MKVIANAKLNLDLSILGCQDGYHMLQSSVTTVNIGDTIVVNARSDRQVNVYGMDIPQQSNIAYRVAQLVVDVFNTSGVDIVINKGIPYMSGMGGSSADGAGVLYAMCKMYNIATSDSRIIDIASRVGSDVNYLLIGGCAVISGKGDTVSVLPYTARYFVVTTFDTAISTADIFALYDTRQYTNSGNVLQKVVEDNYDYMNRYTSDIASMGLVTAMTGSGSAYYVETNSMHSAEQLAVKLCNMGHNSVACASTPCGVSIVDN